MSLSCSVSVCVCRNDIAVFCKKFCDSHFSENSDFSCVCRLNINSDIIIVDSEFLQSAGAETFKLLEKNAKKVICFLSSDSETEIRNFAEEKFRFILQFPVKENLFLSCCDSIKAEFEKNLKKSYCNSFGNLSKNPNENKKLCHNEKTPDSIFGFFAGNSAAIKEARKKIFEFSKNNFPLLFLGETGTGKSTAAKMIHQLSSRKANPFVAINASSVVESLAVSAFFGVNDGAYTDAVNQNGVIKNADKGTLFIDEIGTASMNIQAMLLSVLETGLVQSVGSDEFQKVDVRFVFATNANLADMMKKGEFRQDLYFRISDNLIMLPPLRERKEDIPLIAQSIAREFKTEPSDDAFPLLCEYDWPGNIRELRQCIRRASDSNPEKIIKPEMLDFGLFA